MLQAHKMFTVMGVVFFMSLIGIPFPHIQGNSCDSAGQGIWGHFYKDRAQGQS